MPVWSTVRRRACSLNLHREPVSCERTPNRNPLNAEEYTVEQENERSIHDAMCVVRSLIKKKFMIPGGAAPEMEVDPEPWTLNLKP